MERGTVLVKSILFLSPYYFYASKIPEYLKNIHEISPILIKMPLQLRPRANNSGAKIIIKTDLCNK